MKIHPTYEAWFKEVSPNIRHLTLEMYKEIAKKSTPASYSAIVRRTVTYNLRHALKQPPVLATYVKRMAGATKGHVVGVSSHVSHSTGLHLALFDCDNVDETKVALFRDRIHVRCGGSYFVESSLRSYHVLCTWAIPYEVYARVLETERDKGCVDEKFINITLARHQGTLRVTTRE